MKKQAVTARGRLAMKLSKQNRVERHPQSVSYYRRDSEESGYRISTKIRHHEIPYIENIGKLG